MRALASSYVSSVGATSGPSNKPSRSPLAASVSSKFSRRCTLNTKKSLAATTRASPLACAASRTSPSTNVNSSCAAARMSSGASSGRAMSSSMSSSSSSREELSEPSVPPRRVFAVPYLFEKCVSSRFRALIKRANSPAMTLVLCPLYTASWCLYAANVLSCTKTSAPRANRAIPILSHVSPSKHKRRPGRSHPRTIAGVMVLPSLVCTSNPALRRAYSFPGGKPSSMHRSASIRPAWSGSSITYPKQGTGCRSGAARTTSPPLLPPRSPPAFRGFSLCTVQYGRVKEPSHAADQPSRSLKCGAVAAPLSGQRSPRNIF
mmetsp:Transcript_10079/g.42876  ORF Transcript_10079/g.42876 Transcript_10079/m.42876 type:complete len:319 (-) Transcript_10079:2-958(-)